MTTTVAQLIEFLRQFPPETEVDVLAGWSNGAYMGDSHGRRSLALPAEPWNGESYWTGACVEYSGPVQSLDKSKTYAATLFLGKED